MTKKCIYCSSPIDESSVVDVCPPCGYQVWGQKMFETIVSNMESARETGDLNQGSVSEGYEPEESNSKQTEKLL